jgi:hypothetical protein
MHGPFGLFDVLSCCQGGRDDDDDEREHVTTDNSVFDQPHQALAFSKRAAGVTTNALFGPSVVKSVVTLGD